jgi:hypothetical protein
VSHSVNLIPRPFKEGRPGLFFWPPCAPVILPPGRAKLAMKPEPTGSETFTNTIGLSEVRHGSLIGSRRFDPVVSSTASWCGTASVIPWRIGPTVSSLLVEDFG